MIKLLNKYFKTVPSKPLVRIAKPSELPKNRPKLTVVEKNIKNFSIPPKVVNISSSNGLQDDWFIQIGAMTMPLI
jgi:hypothetical protein